MGSRPGTKTVRQNPASRYGSTRVTKRINFPGLAGRRFGRTPGNQFVKVRRGRS
jgi:hypothetical protein